MFRHLWDGRINSTVFFARSPYNQCLLNDTTTKNRRSENLLLTDSLNDNDKYVYRELSDKMIQFNEPQRADQCCQSLGKY